MAAARKPVPTSNLAAAQSGDRRAALVALRDTLARSMDECDPNMHAQIAGQYRATLAELAALPAVEESGLRLIQGSRSQRRSKTA